MIRPDKFTNALAALQHILVAARAMAYDEEPHDQIAEVLDWAEYLPYLIGCKQDRTEEFEGILRDLHDKHNSFCRHAYMIFQRDPPKW